MQIKTNQRLNKIVYLIDGARTPFLKMRQDGGPFSATELAVSAARTLVRRYVEPHKFNQVIVGCAGPSEEEANIARIIALRIGCGVKMPAWTVQRNCASGLQAIDSAAQSIASGKCELVLAGGTEAMSRAPLILSRPMVQWLAQLRQAKNFTQRLKSIAKFHPQFLIPTISLLKGLTDPVVNLSMGQTAEELAYRFEIARTEMDAFALQSHQRAVAAQKASDFEEIIPLYANDGTVYETDEGIRADSSLEKLAKLKPVFEKFGDITAGNSSQISDGAAFVILASVEAVERYDLPVLAKIVDVEWAALDPSIMGLGPVQAITPLLRRNHLTFNDIDQFEINEAFAAQVLACRKAWADPNYCVQELGLEIPWGEIDMERLNPQGGAIALGHPVGASGARLVLHCAKMMEKYKFKKSVVSLCVGGGQGGAMLLERVGI